MSTPYLLGHLPDPDDHPCPKCRSLAGDPCANPTGRPYVDQNGPRFHAARYRRAGHKLTGHGHVIAAACEIAEGSDG